jgi:beta-lactamase regulating signal transducer with metallopeptidase domain
MPLLMRWQWLPAYAQIRVTMRGWRQAPESSRQGAATPSSVLPVTPHAAASLTLSRESQPAGGDRFPAPSISKSEFNPSDQARPKSTAYSNKPIQAAAGPRLNRLATLGGLLYFAVCGALLLRLMCGLATAIKLWTQAEPIRLHREMKIAPGLRLRSSSAVFSPVTIGSGVVLPADYAQWDAEKLRIVLAHEHSHIRQGDFYLQTLAGLYAVLFWFSPLGWWLKHRLSDLGEAISDRAGLEQASSRASYAQVLLEFAAMPRPTLTGVAMARTSNLSHRIERLLNDSTFRQAFAGNRRRALLVALLVPIALFAGTALIRVEAAGQAQDVQAPPAPAAQTAPTSGQALPDQAPAPAAAPDQIGAGSIAPGGPPASGMPPAPMDPVAPPPPIGPGSTAIPQGAPDTPPAPPAPDLGEGEGIGAGISGSQSKHTSVSNGNSHGYSYSYSSNGDSWALITDTSQHVTFSGNWSNYSKDTIDKVRKLTNGKFLWFTHDGKSYFIDDPAVMARIEALYKPMEALGVQQEKLGIEQEALGRQQEEMGRKQELTSVPTPDLSKEMAKLNEAMAKLDAKKGSTVSRDELADIEGELGAIQGRLGALQGEMGAKQGEFGALQGKLGEQQGKLGAEQGRLGAEQGRIAAEADRTVRTIIDESLRNGKARPVE